MKKSLLLLTAALTFGMAAAQTTSTASAPQVPTLTDVPAGHWAKDAIDKLVSRGIILGYPDGTFRGTQNLTRYEAAVIIARLLDQIGTGQVPAGSIDADTLTSLQNAIQELAADLAALGVRVTDLEENAVSRDDFTRLEDRVNSLAAASGDAEAVAAIQSQIDALTARADDYDTLRADVDDNASSIAALNDLTVLLNQDILNLQDRVSAVEAAQADFVQRADFDNLSGRVGGIDTRVTKLENAPKFTISGTVSASYGALARTSGSNNFDVDRLTRQTFADGVFSTGNNCLDGTYSLSGNPVSCVDMPKTYLGDSYGLLGINATNLSTADGKFVVNTAAVNFYLTNFGSGTSDVGLGVDNISVAGTLAGQKFDVRYEPYRSSFKFNDYLFANDNAAESGTTPTLRRGVVANVQADLLPLKPKLTIVVGSATPTGLLATGVAGAAAGSGAVPGFSGAYYGVRASVNPGTNSTFGVAFAQNDGNRSALGADYSTKFGPVSLDGAAVLSAPQSAGSITSGSSSIQNVLNTADKAFYTNAAADLGILKFGANFRAITGGFANGAAGMSTNDAPYFYGYKTSMPYNPDQVGYGGGLGTNLGPIALGAFGDSYTPYNGGDRRSSFGVGAGVQFAGLSLKGFYNRSMLNGTTVATDSTFQGPGGYSYNLTSPYQGVADVPFAWSSTYGGQLKHDGAASNAIIKGLNFTVADQYFYDRTATITTATTTTTYTAYANDFQAYANYSGTFGGVKIEPFVRYHLFMTPDVNGDGTRDAVNSTAAAGNTLDGTAANTYNTFKYGVKLSTQPMTAVPLQPSVFVNFANRVTNNGTQLNFSPNANSRTSELFGQAGITLNQFIVPDMKASVGYAYYQGYGVGNTLVASSASGASATYSAAADRIYRSPFSGGDTPFNGDNYGTANGRLNGVFGQVSWLGLAANYGVFNHYDFNTGVNSVAQGFKVSYTFKF